MGKNLELAGRILYFCAGGSCAQKGAEHLIRETRALLKTEGQYGMTHTVKTHCAGQCEHGPVLAVHPDNIWYGNMDCVKSERVVRGHLMAGIPVDEFILHPQEKNEEEEVASRSSGKSIPFESREIEGLGRARAASMHAWEIILYPLMKDLFVNRFQGLEFKVPGLGSTPFTLDQPAQMAYDGTTVAVESEVAVFSLVIGLFKERDPDYTRLWRARIAEAVFIETAADSDNTSGRVLVATSRSGERALEVRFPASGFAQGPDPWEHFTRIYLERS